ncbi:MAG: hypothetical protein QOJ29_3636 [Thermoleophilaceae bacterium]|jgi:hypothetical protein|nr:hypothetical protein [Thermoleophilaceae bacterium]
MAHFRLGAPRSFDPGSATWPSVLSSNSAIPAKRPKDIGAPYLADDRPSMVERGCLVPVLVQAPER